MNIMNIFHSNFDSNIIKSYALLTWPMILPRSCP